VPTVTSKGQITLPKRVREALGIGPGSQVEFEVTGGVAVMRKRLAPHAIERWRGYLRGRGEARSSDEVVQALRGP
jgi:AbrB family looped-hinge helix DNA binding protein